MTIIACPSCQSSFEIPGSALMPQGRLLQCSQCLNSWFVDVNGQQATPPEPDPDSEQESEPQESPSDQAINKEFATLAEAPLIFDDDEPEEPRGFVTFDEPDPTSAQEDPDQAEEMQALPPLNIQGQPINVERDRGSLEEMTEKLDKPQPPAESPAPPKDSESTSDPQQALEEIQNALYAQASEEENPAMPDESQSSAQPNDAPAAEQDEPDEIDEKIAIGRSLSQINIRKQSSKASSEDEDPSPDTSDSPDSPDSDESDLVDLERDEIHVSYSPRMRDRERRTSIGGWLFMMVLLISAGVSVYLFPDRIVQFYPPVASVFVKAGLLDPLGSGLIIHPPRTEVLTRAGRRSLLVVGEIENSQTASTAIADVPLLRAALVDNNGREIQVWSFTADDERILPGEVIRYRTEIGDPPLNVRSIRITFMRAEESKFSTTSAS